MDSINETIIQMRKTRFEIGDVLFQGKCREDEVSDFQMAESFLLKTEHLLNELKFNECC